MGAALSRPQPPITAEERLASIRQLGVDFSAHIKTSPGAVLPPELRLGVAVCARDALLKCGGCRQFLEGAVCLRPGSSFYEVCGELQHEPAFSLSPDANWSDDVRACLVNIVHAVICHQSRLDKIWYDDTIDALQSCGVLDDYAEQLGCKGDPDEMKLAAHAAFSEIVLLAGMSEGLYATFLALGVDPPPLPLWEDMKKAPKPLNLRFSSLLRKVRRNENEAQTPYFQLWDVNKNSSEYARVGDEVWGKISRVPLPDVCLRFSPGDVSFFESRYSDTLYVKAPSEVLFIDSLDPMTHCASVSRFDLETISTAVAVGHECDF